MNMCLTTIIVPRSTFIPRDNNRYITTTLAEEVTMMKGDTTTTSVDTAYKMERKEKIHFLEHRNA